MVLMVRRHLLLQMLQWVQLLLLLLLLLQVHVLLQSMWELPQGRACMQSVEGGFQHGSAAAAAAAAASSCSIIRLRFKRLKKNIHWLPPGVGAKELRQLEALQQQQNKQQQ